VASRSRYRVSPNLLGRFAVAACFVVCCSAGRGQVESVPAASGEEPLFVSYARVEGRLALNYSPAGAFSPDSQKLAVIVGQKVALLDLAGSGAPKILKPGVPDVTDLDIESTNFLSPTRLLILARGTMNIKGKAAGRTPLLAFQWYVGEDRVAGKVEAVGGGGGFAPILFLPELGYLAMYKEGKITLWDPNSGRGGQIPIAELTHRPGYFTLAPGGRWILLARIENNATPDPVVVDAKEQKFVDVLQGHHGTVLSVNFSRDGQRVVTACEDGKVRLWSAGDWKLLQTLSGHNGPVHWAEFSADGKWIVSAGEDKTLRIWSAEDGRLVQTLEESKEPLLTAAFSPDGNDVAATSEQTVLVWQRRR
jgi:WD domain, G-beta repeat